MNLNHFLVWQSSTSYHLRVRTSVSLYWRALILRGLRDKGNHHPLHHERQRGEASPSPTPVQYAGGGRAALSQAQPRIHPPRTVVWACEESRGGLWVTLLTTVQMERRVACLCSGTCDVMVPLPGFWGDIASYSPSLFFSFPLKISL